MAKPPTPPVAAFHSPEELLETARELLSTPNPKVYRAAVLEAQAALETFIQRTVFPALQTRFPKDFVEWLKKKTNMDFDTRLSILVPIATGISIDTGSPLWSAHKKIRELRKGVVHGSHKVTLPEAQMAITNTADWIAYLGRTVELEKAMLDLKHWVESQPSPVARSWKEAEQIVAQFFTRSKVANVEFNKVFQLDGRRLEADAILEFGAQQVVVETKFAGQPRPLHRVLDDALQHAQRIRAASKIRLAAVVVFAALPKEQIPAQVGRHEGGEVYSVVIRA